VACTGLVLAANQGTDALRAEKDKLKGTWAVEAVRLGNDNLDEGLWKDSKKDYRLTFEDDSVVIQGDADPKSQKAAYKLNLTKSPKELDIGQGSSLKEYIYKFDGDKLVVAFARGVLVSGGTFAEVQRDTVRPRDFKETEETAAPFVLVLKRVKR
jgi:uncharacterized protein (TIGR03067 family)